MISHNACQKKFFLFSSSKAFLLHFSFKRYQKKSNFITKHIKNFVCQHFNDMILSLSFLCDWHDNVKFLFLVDETSRVWQCMKKAFNYNLIDILGIFLSVCSGKLNQQHQQIACTPSLCKHAKIIKIEGGKKTFNLFHQSHPSLPKMRPRLYTMNWAMKEEKSFSSSGEQM